MKTGLTTVEEASREVPESVLPSELMASEEDVARLEAPPGRILVEADPTEKDEKRTAGGVLIPAGSATKGRRWISGEVIAVGAGVDFLWARNIKKGIPGDTVFFHSGSQHMSFGGLDVFSLIPEELLAFTKVNIPKEDSK